MDSKYLVGSNLGLQMYSGVGREVAASGTGEIDGAAAPQLHQVGGCSKALSAPPSDERRPRASRKK